MEGPPPLIAAPPPLPNNKPAPLRHLLAILLSACLALFVFDAVLSLTDDFLIVFFGLHSFSAIRSIVAFFAVLMALGLYALIGLSPMVPKRLFLPIPIFFFVTTLAGAPFAIFWFYHLAQISLAVSLCQFVLALVILFRARRGSEFLPLVSANSLTGRFFSWRHLSIFALANALVVLPLVAIYLFVCTSFAVNRFSEGFMALRPGGFSVQVRKYVRDDGKVIELFPMVHVADASFYREVWKTFPTNCVILMEGISDSHNLLTNSISYKRMAKTLGLTEQREFFRAKEGGGWRLVRADVDVNQFSPGTIDLLNVVTLLHAKGLNAETLSKLLQQMPSQDAEEQLFDDILRKRNDHLTEEIQSWVPRSDNIMVPWGVAHMPGIAREIQSMGFHLVEMREYSVIHFGRKR